MGALLYMKMVGIRRAGEKKAAVRRFSAPGSTAERLRRMECKLPEGGAENPTLCARKFSFKCTRIFYLLQKQWHIITRSVDIIAVCFGYLVCYNEAKKV